MVGVIYSQMLLYNFIIQFITQRLIKYFHKMYTEFDFVDPSGDLNWVFYLNEINYARVIRPQHWNMLSASTRFGMSLYHTDAGADD